MGQKRTSRVVIEMTRLMVVVLFLAVGFVGAAPVSEWFVFDLDQSRLFGASFGAAMGYLFGGAIGRRAVAGVDHATTRLQTVSSADLLAAAAGAVVSTVLVGVLALPLLLSPWPFITVPVTVLLMALAVYAGSKVGLARSADLSRFVGVRGRLEVTSPSRGVGVRLVDTSALVDGRLVAVVRTGFLSGTLVVPEFVLHEVQGLADAGESTVRSKGQRALDQLQLLQDEGLVAVEVTDESVPEYAEVDAKLASLARSRQAQLVTCDSALARVAEVGGVRVLNIHALADAVRPEVMPGERVGLHLVREGRDAGQGVGYLADGTMVVVDNAAAHVGEDVEVDITSVTQGRRGRMLFGSVAP